MGLYFSVFSVASKLPVAMCAFAKPLVLGQALTRYSPCRDLWMQNDHPQNHVATFGHQIFGFKVNGQDHIVEASIVRAQGLSRRISTISFQI